MRLSPNECAYIIETAETLHWRVAHNHSNNRVWICDEIDQDLRFNALVQSIMPPHRLIEKARVHFMKAEDQMDSHIDTVYEGVETIIVRLNEGDPRFIINDENTNEKVGVPNHVPHHVMHGVIKGNDDRYSLAIWYK